MMAAYGTYTDQELLILLKTGDRTAFAEIFNKYRSLLFSHVYKKIRDREEAKDIVQEVFTGLWTKRAEINQQSNLGGYLMMAVKHKVLDLVGHKEVESRYFESLSSYSSIFDGKTDYPIREKQLQSIIDREIEALPQKMREVFLMSRMEQLSHKEIAQKLNLSEETVNTHIKRALKTLKIRLGLILYLVMLIKM